MDLEVSQCVPQTVRQSGLKPQQGLDGHLVDLLEALAVHAGEVLDLELLDEILVGVGEEHLPHDPAGVEAGLPVGELGGEQLGGHLLGDEFLAEHVLDDGSLLFPFGILDFEEHIELISEKLYGTRMSNYIFVYIEAMLHDIGMSRLEFLLKEICKSFWVGNRL